MAKENERTFKMMKAYPDLYDKGMTNKEIADFCGVSYKTVLYHLGDIAQNMGVSRESLLEKNSTRSKRPISDGVIKLFERYPDLHKAGLSNPDIAKQCGIGVTTLYGYLQEIADEMGVSRESLVEECGRKKCDKKSAPEVLRESLVEVCDKKSAPEVKPSTAEAEEAVKVADEPTSMWAKAHQILEEFKEVLAYCDRAERSSIDVFVDEGRILINGELAENEVPELTRSRANEIIWRPECAQLTVGQVELLAMLLEITRTSGLYDLFVDDRDFLRAFVALRDVF